MIPNLTPFARPVFASRGKAVLSRTDNGEASQLQLLRTLLEKGAHTEYGRRHGFSTILDSNDISAEYASQVPLREYEEIRGDVMRMMAGERDILWPGLCKRYAQSSGTSGGRSKYIPVTEASLRHNHYQGSFDAVATYLQLNPGSRMFSGKGLVLGGSYANTLQDLHKDVLVGDLSATLIDRTPWPASAFKAPSKQIALLRDWNEKLPLLAESVCRQDITNLSGVPSWMLVVLRKVLQLRGAESLKDVWPDLEVFFHGGISFLPYREEYLKITRGCDMHFHETYNASEGFFGVGSGQGDMLLLVDAGIYYEFFRPGDARSHTTGQLEPGKVYEMVITGMNGLWRYRIGDTVLVTGLNPLRIKVAGRTKAFINAFGEELMEHNAEEAIAEVSRETGAQVSNYTASPVYAEGGHRGRHEWIIEWDRRPADVAVFARRLDEALQRLNSDYEAKRKGGIFLDPLTIVEAPQGTFHRWLGTYGSRRLGGQRKVPRLSNSRTIADELLSLIK